MTTPEIIEMLFNIVLIPLLGTLTIFAVKFLNAKSKDLQQAIDNCR